MKRRGFAFVAAAIVVLSVCLSAQVAPVPIQDRDGAWWRSLSEGPGGESKLAQTVKRLYVSGLIDGATAMLSAISPDDATYKKLTDVYLVPTLDPAQIADGLDAYYSDFKNRHDAVGVAFLKVLNQIRVRKL